GTICGLVGENGAGKSTTIRLLMGALRPDSGEISVLGVSPGDPAFRKVKEDIGVVLDDSYFPDCLDAAVIGKIMAATYENWDQPLYESYLDRFSLPRKKRFKDYSRGMRMKLGIAAALSHHPKLLVLDEPTAGLDPIVREEVVELFREFALESEKHSILISSHILSDLEKLCDTIAFLHEGRLLFCEGKDALLESCGVFVGTAAQSEEIDPSAVIGRESNGLGGVRMLVRRELVPSALVLEKPTVEDIILFTVKGAKR
ncbi:MAG: ABC transporter ATP-binding protein, partial [Oscillospiraceae bacterium]|nr:ABC transporter ATP-binding protein [Oscillospiraceae bacterium]